MKVSFDFDSCLSEEIIQKVCRVFLKENKNDVYIITSRLNNFYNKNYDLYVLADKLGILKENIHFTNEKFKWEKILELKIDLHFDDMEDEVHLINAHGGCALLFNLDIETCKYLFNEISEGNLEKNTININKI